MGCRQMYVMYYDCGTTNTRGYLLKNNHVVQQAAEQIGAKNSALEKDNHRLLRELFVIYESLLKKEGISDSNVQEIYLSGMISSPSGIVEVEHLSTPVSRDRLKNSIVEYYDQKLFQRPLKIIPGIKTVRSGIKVPICETSSINMMRGEETEVFGMLHENSEVNNGTCILILPGRHTQAVLLNDGIITNISSNITGELFQAITKETILGSSVSGDGSWEISADMVCLGAKNTHLYGFNRALYILRVQDLFTGASLNERRSYLEGVLNVGVMDAVQKMVGNDGEKIRLIVAGHKIQENIYTALCQNLYPHFEICNIKNQNDMPYSVNGVLAMLK